MPETNLLGFTPTSGIVDDIRKKNKPFITSQSYTPSGNLFGGGGSSSRGGKTLTMMDTVNAQPLENTIGGETGVSAEDALVKLSDGTYINKYKDYFVGTDNDERLAQQQTAGEKWANGVEKALLKTGNAVLGGTAGIVYGIGALATEGSLSALYDNDFSNTLADWDTKLGYQLPNYYTKQEQEKGLGGQMGTANFWADKVLGGLSFTAGAIISEGLWAAATGGTSLAVGAAKWGARLGRGAADVAKAERWTVEALGEAGALTALAKNKGYLKQAIGTAFEAGRINIKTATNLGLAADVFNTARFAVTSAGFESSVEALQYKKEATANFYSTFFDKNGREPDANDIATFNNNLTNSANAVFGVNMAIVGSSNLVTMGKLFELKNPIKTGFTEFIEAKAFGYGIKAGKVLEATRAQKIGRNIFAYSKAPITEGLYEEGLQGVTTKTANKWIDHTYSDKNTAETFSTIGAVYESLAEQYGTKEGWVENGVGMIIGALGGSVNTRSEQKAKQAQLEFKAQGIETFSPEKGLLVQALMPKKVMMANQIAGFSAEAKAEAEQGNIAKSEIAGGGVIHAFLNHKYALGESFDEAAKEIKTALDTITEEQFKNAEIANPTAWKEQKLNEFVDKAKTFKKNRKFSEYIIGKNPTKGEQGIASILGDTFQGMNRNEALIQSMTWILTEGETAGKFMKDIQAKMLDEVGTEHTTTLETISKLNKLSGYKTAERESVINDYKNLTKERDKVQQEIAKLNAAPKETEGDKPRGKALEAANLRLLDLNDNIAELDAKLNSIADDLNKQDSYQKDVKDIDLSQDISGTTITAQTLLDLNDNVDKFKNLVESLKASNPQRGAYISDLLDEYSQAEDIFLANQRTMDMLTSGKMKLEKINTWLGKKMFKNKSMDEASKEWLTDALNRYEKNVLSTVGAITQEAPKTKEELTARKEELTNLPEEDKTEETDKELKDINEQLKEPTNKNREVTPKSDIQKQIEALEAERAQKLAEVKPIEVKEKQTTTAEELEQQKAKELSEVKPIIVRERVETPSTFETIKDAKEEERLSAKKQKIEDSISKLEDGTTSENRTKVTIDSVNAPKGITFELIDGVWKTKSTFTKRGIKVDLIPADAKALQKIEEKLKENPNTAKIEKLKEQLAEVEQQLENIPTVEREVKQEPTFTETEVENTAEINRINTKYEKLSKEEATPQESISQEDSIQQQKDKINKEYDQRIQKLKTPPVDNSKVIEDYKNRIERMLAKGYYSLENIGKNYEDLKDLEPTQEEIEEFRKGKVELEEKLSNWKLLSSATDAEGNSIADLVKLIKQLETPQKETDTKTELTEEELTTQLSDEIESSGLKYDPTLLQNVLGTVTVKNLSDSGTYRFSHVKMSYIVQQLDKPYTVKRLGKTKEISLDDLQPNDVVYVDDIAITYLAGGVIEMKQTDFQTRQQVLNMYIRATKTVNWSYIDVYSVVGDSEIKMPSQFTENIVPEEIYNQKEGDILTLHVEDNDNFNEEKGDSVDQLKIYVKDSKGNNLSVLKAGKADGAANPEFLEIRQVAYDRWVAANRPKNMDLGIRVGIDNIFFGAAELIMSDGQPVNIPITPQAIDKVIEAKGYILNGEFTLDTKIKEVNKTFVGRISKNNKDKKIPVIVFKKGVHFVAFPISMVKIANPLTDAFNSIMDSSVSPQEAVNKLNEEIQNNSIEISKLTYSDINDIEKMKSVEDAFNNHTSFVTAETLASQQYKKESLAEDSEIAIDLEDLDRAISSPKIRIDLESLNLGKTLSVLENSALELAKNINDFSNELYSLIQKAPAGILETMEGSKDVNTFINIIEEEANKAREGEMPLDIMNAYDKAINALEKAIPFIPNLKRTAKEYIGKTRLEKAKNYVGKYRNLQAQIRTARKDRNSAEKNSNCK